MSTDFLHYYEDSLACCVKRVRPLPAITRILPQALVLPGRPVPTLLWKDCWRAQPFCMLRYSRP